MTGDHPLLAMARDRDAREQLAAATVDAFLDNADATSLAERTLFADVMVRLYSAARQDVRKKLAAAIAMADWAPPELAAELAMDSIDIAQSVISFCPTLNDDILVTVVRGGTQEHRLCVADRPNIGETVSSALIALDDEIILSTLATNPTARISAEDFQLAMDMLRSDPQTFDQLVRRPDLPPSLIASAYALAGKEARAAIRARMPVPLERRLDKLAALVTGEAAAAAAMPAGDNARASGQIASKPTPGLLLAILMRGERKAFMKGLADLLDLPVKTLTRGIEGGDAEALALAARAANFDRGLVQTLHEQIDSNCAIWSAECDRETALVWMRHTPETAREAFRKKSALQAGLWAAS